MTTPIDATLTDAWSRLDQLHSKLNVDFRQWFEDEARAEKFTYQAGDLFVDMSKSYLTDDIKAALLELAEQVKIEQRRDAMVSGEKINVTEDRAVLHTALRREKGDEVLVDGENVMPQVHEVLDRMYAFADSVRDGSWTGVTGKPMKTIVNVGIGGSDLGPVMAYEALKPYVQEGLECRFISNIDPTDVSETLKDLDPETTLVIVASKTFTTLETLTNARQVRSWLLENLEKQGAPTDGAVAKQDRNSVV